MPRFAIIGTGFMGEKHAECFSMIDGAELTAVVSNDQEQGRSFADKFGIKFYDDYSRMLDDDIADAVDICIPTFLHEDAVVGAASRGKHVFCEKPVTLSRRSLERMLKAVDDAGVSFAVGQVVRFWPENEAVSRMYRRGDFGRVKTVYASRLATHPSWSEWFRDAEKSGGGLFDMHVHDVDYIVYTFGKVDTVFAQGIKNEAGCWNHVSCTLGFASGIKAVVESCIEMPLEYPMATLLRVIGDEKALEYTMRAGKNLEDVDSAVRRTVVYDQREEPRVLEIPDRDAYLDELRYFSDCIDRGEPMEKLSKESVRSSMEVIFAIERSLETGEVVKI